MRSLVRSNHLKLLPVLALAFYLAYIPHQPSPFPVHWDEWVHLACSTELINNGGTEGLTSPFTGGTPIWNQQVEFGFHLFWGIFQQITGISWLVIIRYFPAIIFMFTVLSVYVLGRREGFGWEAALLACLVPTTVGILGPGFLVPMAIGMLFIPLALFVAFNLRGWQSYLMLFMFACFLILTHAATAVVLVIIFVPYILLNFRRGFKHALGVTLALVAPFMVPLPWIFHLIRANLENLFVRTPFPQYVDVPLDFIAFYGYLPTVLFLVGFISLILSGGNKNYGLALGSLALTIMVVTFVQFQYGIELVYLRGSVHLQLMMGIVAGSGLWYLRKAKLPHNLAARLKPAFIRRNFGSVLCVVLIILTIAIAIPARQNISYYHMIDKIDYEAFIWITENVEEDYDKVILDPWKATAFTAITGRKVYARALMTPDEKSGRAYEFLWTGCSDTAFLKENGITIVYTRQDCKNPDLVEVRRYVYLLEVTTHR